MTANILHLRREHYVAMPWRNGAGVTQEIACRPASGSDFVWRLSLAKVTTSGPFSNYSGYRRSVTLIDGAGFRLDFGDDDSILLDSVGTTALFSGGASTVCTLIDGPSSDLSLVVREPGAIVSVTRHRSNASQMTPLRAGALSAVFCLGGQIILTVADDPMGTGQEREDFELALHDTLLIGPDARALSVGPSPIGPIDLLLLTWQP
jgi:environmental stress-induced protein Ves